MERVHDFRVLESAFKKYKFENLNIIGRIRNSTDIEIYSMDTNKENLSSFIMYDENRWYAPFSNDEEELKNIIANYNFNDNPDFCGVPFSIAELIKDTLSKEYVLDWDEHCYLFYLPQEKNNIYLDDTSIDLDSLREHDLELVNEFYTYKEEGSSEYLRECILNRPSSVYRDENGKAISWALVREDNSMGVMYTLKEHRKKGLAKIVSKDLIKKVINTGYTPYVHIVEDNNPSINLAKELGMVNWGKVLWFGMKKL